MKGSELGEERKRWIEKRMERHERGGTERSQGQEVEPGALSAQGQKLFLADLSHTYTHSQSALSVPSFLLVYNTFDDLVDINGV